MLFCKYDRDFLEIMLHVDNGSREHLNELTYLCIEWETCIDVLNNCLIYSSLIFISRWLKVFGHYYLYIYKSIWWKVIICFLKFFRKVYFFFFNVFWFLFQDKSWLFFVKIFIVLSLLKIKFIYREIYHTKRMQRVVCVKWSLDNKYIISGSDEMNIRLWKAFASQKLGVVSFNLISI